LYQGECSFKLPDRNIEHNLQKIPFLPVMQKPEHYPISWKGYSVTKFLSGPELTKVSDRENSVNVVMPVGHK